MLDLHVPQSGVNAFSQPIPSLAELTLDENVVRYIRAGLNLIFNDIGLEDDVRREIVETCLAKSRSCKSLLEYERDMHAYLESKKVFSVLPKKTAGRAERMVEVVREFLCDGSILDLGCGPGGVGKICAALGYDVTLADVYQNPSIAALQLPFVALQQNQPLPFSNESFDNVLVFAMLHHVEDPLQMISEIHRILRIYGRLHLIETVYGIRAEELSADSSVIDQQFATLSPEQQRLATMFFDYFGNHVTWYYTEDPDKYVPVPFNFNTPEFWQTEFKKQDFLCLRSRPWKVDPGSGVFHYLLTLEKN